MNSTLVIVVAFGTAAIAAAGTYWGVVRKLSGKITTSEASQLWAESSAIRTDYRDENVRLYDRLVLAEARIAKMESNAEELRQLNRELQKICDRLTAELEAVKKENELLRAENKALLARIDGLEESLRKERE